MSNHISIIGAGEVGTSIAFSLINKKLGSKISLVDINQEKLAGEVMDLQQGLFFTETANVEKETFRGAAQADIIVVTAGAAQKPGETRLDLVKKNVAILKNIFEQMGQIKESAIVLLVTNPVDILTHLAQKLLHLPTSQVFGSGTSLDTSRLRHFLGQHFQINPKNTHAYIIGEHGDSEFPAFSIANIAGVPLENFPGYDAEMMQKIGKQTKNAAYEIIKRKGATNYAIALAVTEILEALLLDQNLVLPLSVPVSSYYQEKYQVPPICLGLPTVLSRQGAERVLELNLSPEEGEKLRKSGEKLAEVWESVK